MKESEQQLITYLSQVGEYLVDIDAQWSEMMLNAADRARSLFLAQQDAKTKYDLVKAIQEFYGGMGSFNEIDLPPECGNLHSDLYASIKDLLRAYWKELGREWHEFSEYKIHRRHTEVRLIPGKVIYYERDDSPSKVKDTEAANEHTWVVVRCDGPDVTNMPVYLIRKGNTFRAARHEALEVVRKRVPG